MAGAKPKSPQIAACAEVSLRAVLTRKRPPDRLPAAVFRRPDGKALLCPELFWDTTVLYAQRQGVPVKRVPLAADMSVDLDALAAAIGPDVGMVQIGNPTPPAWCWTCRRG